MVTVPMSDQIETLKPQSPLKSTDPNLQIPPLISIIETPHAAAATGISHTTQNPSKIPIRPQKIRKLSNPNPTPSTDDKPSPPQSAQTTTTTGASPIIPTVAKTRRRSSAQASSPFPRIIRSLSVDGEIEIALAHLRAADPILAPLIDIHPPPQFESHLAPFHALTKSIIYQQLACKAGTSIYTRFIALCGDEDSVCPDSVLALSSQQLKQIGVSSRKASYLYDLANKYKSGILSDDMVVKMDDRSLFTMLSMVKGIGSWSVHMFMIFSLHRPDVLPVSDLGVRKGVQLLYGLEDLPRPSQMEQLCEKWRPYRSVGAWYMWRFVDGNGSMPAGSVVSLEGNFVQPLQQIEAQQHELQFVEPVNGIGNLG